MKDTEIEANFTRFTLENIDDAVELRYNGKMTTLKQGDRVKFTHLDKNFNVCEYTGTIKIFAWSYFHVPKPNSVTVEVDDGCLINCKLHTKFTLL